MTPAERIRSIIIKHLNADPDRVVPEATLFELGADSFDVAWIVMEFEFAFDLNIPDDAMDRLKTIGDAIALVDRMLAEEVG